MLSFFRLQQQPSLYLGVQIDDGTVSVVALHRHQEQVYWLFGECWQSDDLGAINKLSLALSAYDLSQAVITSCVPASTVMLQTLDLPANLNDADIEAQLILDADQYINQPLDEVNFDFAVLAQSPIATKILLAIAHRSAISDCQDRLAIANLEPTIIEPKTFAIARAVRDVSSDDQPVMVLDIGKHQSTLAIWQAAGVMTTQVQFVGWADLPMMADIPSTPPVDAIAPSDTDAMMAWQTLSADEIEFGDDLPTSGTRDANQNQLGRFGVVQGELGQADFCQSDKMGFEVDLDQADFHQANFGQTDFWQTDFEQADFEQIKSKQSGDWQHINEQNPRADLAVGDQASSDEQAIEQMVNGLLPSMRLLGDNANIKQVLLIGVSGKLANRILVALQAKLAWQVSLPNLPSHSLVNVADVDEQNFSALFAAYGLARRAMDNDSTINLLDWRAEWQVVKRQQIYRALRYLVLLAVAMVLMVAGWLWYQNDEQAAINALLEQKILEQNEKIAQIEHIKQQIKQHKTNLGVVHDLDRHNADWLQHWQQLAMLVPQGVYLQNVSLAEQMQVAGIANHTDAITSFASQLEQSGLYGSVMIHELQQDTSSPTMRFAMTLERLDNVTMDKAAMGDVPMDKAGNYD